VQSAPSPELALARKCSARDGESCLRLAQSQEAAGGANAETVGLLVKACDFKVAAGCTLAADAIGQGKVGDPDPSRAAELHARSCELRATTTGCETVAANFRDGAHVEKDPARAQKLFAQACTAGSVGACDSAAELALGRDESAALTAWKKGCELGSAEACSKHTELDLRRTKLAAALKVEAERKEKKENQTFWRRAGYVSGGIGVAAGGASGLLAFLGSQRNESLRAGDYDDFGDQDFAVSTGTPLNIGAWGFAAISTVAVGTALGLVLFNLEDEDDGGLITPKASIVVAPSSVTLQLGGF
jgi:TPR repeat protein